MKQAHVIQLPQHRDPIARMVLLMLPVVLVYLALAAPQLGQAREDVPSHIRYAALVPENATQGDIQPLVAVLPTAAPTLAPTSAPEPTAAPAPTAQPFEALAAAPPTADPASFAPPPPPPAEPQAPAWQPPAEPPPPPPPTEAPAPTLVPAVLGAVRDQAPQGALAPNAGMPQPGDAGFADSFEAPPAPNCHFVGGPNCRVPRTDTHNTADRVVDHVQGAINNAIDSVQP